MYTCLYVYSKSIAGLYKIICHPQSILWKSLKHFVIKNKTFKLLCVLATGEHSSLSTTAVHIHTQLHMTHAIGDDNNICCTILLVSN